MHLVVFDSVCGFLSGCALHAAINHVIIALYAAINHVIAALYAAINHIIIVLQMQSLA